VAAHVADLRECTGLADAPQRWRRPRATAPACPVRGGSTGRHRKAPDRLPGAASRRPRAGPGRWAGSGATADTRAPTPPPGWRGGADRL